MDLIDKKILTILDANSRTPSSEIGKKLKKSRQLIEYRIDQLVKKKIILNFTTLIDPTKFKQNIWHIYIKLQNITAKIDNEIISYLNSTKEVWWIAKCQGEWDLIFSVAGNDIVKFDDMISAFRSRFHSYINQLQITTMIKAEFFPRGYFIGKETKKRTLIGDRNTVKIDNKDLAILKILATNSRMASTKIAESTKLSARQVIYRIKELEKKKVIRMYRLHLNFTKLEYDYYKVCFYTEDFTETSEKTIITWCETNPNAINYAKKLSPWTFEIEFETEDYKKLNELLKELRNKFGNIIKRTETTLISEEYKGELDILKTAE